MSSTSSFLRFVAILLVFESVHCDNYVGHGKHVLDGEDITELKVNTVIAEKKEDIERYKGLKDSCDVEMDNVGNVILWYKKDSKTKSDGCSVDFVTKKKGEISLQFGIQDKISLAKCLGEWEENMPIDNMLSFAFSLNNDEWDEIKDGPKNGNDNDCGNDGKKQCKIEEGDCLKSTAFYSIGWSKKKSEYICALTPVGEVKYVLAKMKEDKKDKNALSELLIEGETFRLEGKGTLFNTLTYCYKNLQKPEEWEIKDEKYKETKFKYLFTFHIMPVEAMLKSMREIFLKCKSDYTKVKCKSNPSMQKCDEMFIKFDKDYFKLLVPETKSTTNYITTKTTSKIKSNSTSKTQSGSTENVKFSSSKTITKSETETTEKPEITDESEEKKVFGIEISIVIIVGVVIICCIITVFCIGILICVKKGKNKEEMKQSKAKPSESVVQTKSIVTKPISKPTPKPSSTPKPRIAKKSGEAISAEKKNKLPADKKEDNKKKDKKLKEEEDDDDDNTEPPKK